jgi:hypothetical protein
LLLPAVDEVSAACLSAFAATPLLASAPTMSVVVAFDLEEDDVSLEAVFWLWSVLERPVGVSSCCSPVADEVEPVVVLAVWFCCDWVDLAGEVLSVPASVARIAVWLVVLESDAVFDATVWDDESFLPACSSDVRPVADNCVSVPDGCDAIVALPAVWVLVAEFCAVAAFAELLDCVDDAVVPALAGALTGAGAAVVLEATLALEAFVVVLREPLA